MELTQIQKLIERRHPEHLENCGEWEFLRKALEGGPKYVNGNLFKYPKEDPTVYAERLKRAADHHYNLTSQVMDTYEGYLFQQEPVDHNDLSDTVTEFLKEATQDKKSYSDFLKCISTWMAGYGLIHIGVDKPKAPAMEDGKIRSKAEEDQLGLKPYAYLIHPTHLLDGKIKNGKLVWALVKEDSRDDEDPFNSTGEAIVKYRLWTTTSWHLFGPTKDAQGKVNYSLEDEGAHTLGEVPIVTFKYSKKGGEFSCPGLITDIAHLDRGIFNKCSQLDEIHYQLTFPQLVIPYEGDLLDDKGNMGPEGRQMMTMGLHSVIPYGVSTGVGKPDFIAPPSEPAASLSMDIEKNSRLALSMALLDGEIAIEGQSSGSASASGVSKAYTFDKLNKRLSSIGKTLEQGTRHVLELVQRWQKETKELPEAPVDLPDNYEVRNLAQEITEVTTLLAGNPPSPTFKSELWKRLVRKALPKAEEKLLNTIDEELDSGIEEAELGIGGGLNAIGPERPDPEQNPGNVGSGVGKPGDSSEKTTSNNLPKRDKVPSVADKSSDK